MPSTPTPTHDAEVATELQACDLSCPYFIHNYIRIYDPQEGTSIPFHLWPMQVRVLLDMDAHRQNVILKARQLGLTWLVLARYVWKMLFRPQASILLFSKGEDEAKHLLERMTSMYRLLPPHLQAKGIQVNSKQVFGLTNGSIARAFPSTGGDSYTATDAFIDEADLFLNQGDIQSRVKPTIDAGGTMTLLSRADKSKPQSEFKLTYQAAVEGENNYHPIFLPWHSRPDRTPEWYEGVKRDILSTTGSLDRLYEHYPATPEEALAPNSADKVIPADFLRACYERLEPVAAPGAPSFPGLAVYRPPVPFRRYTLGADPAEGNATSDDSALTVLDALTGEEVCSLAAKIQTGVFGSHIADLARYYNLADTLVERNNHGSAVILWLQENAVDVPLLDGLDDKVGWHTNTASKVRMYDMAIMDFRQRNTEVHTPETYRQLESIEAATYRAPERMYDDRAISYVLALVARTLRGSDFGPATATDERPLPAMRY